MGEFLKTRFPISYHMELLSSSKLTEKKSKFFAFLYSVIDEDDVREVVSVLKRKHKKSSHICYGLILDGEEKFKNDGEVGHPGKVLLRILRENNQNSHILIAVRYFGGIKLGTGGVSRAFRSVGRSCISHDSY